MKLAVICFTGFGYEKMNELYGALMPDSEVIRYCKCRALKDQCDCEYASESIDEWAAKQFEAGRAILFIGAAGIAVRAIAASVKNKLSDSPVLVMDDNGKFVIPLLSGHVGGANELAEQIAEKIHAVPVITTSTDVNKKFAVDIFAKKNELAIANKEGIAYVSGRILGGERISILIGDDIEVNTEGMKEFLERYCNQIEIIKEQSMGASYGNKVFDVYIGRKEPRINKDAEPDNRAADRKYLQLVPKELVLGIGCRRGKTKEEIEAFVLDKRRDILKRICQVATIDVKKDEPGLTAFADSLKVPFAAFSADELNAVQGEFTESEFVRQRVGVGNVSERSAVKAAGEGAEILLQKQMGNGVTLAIAKKKWRLEFNE